MIGNVKEANAILRYDIRALGGKAYDCPIWVLIADVERDIATLDQNGYNWYRDRLQNHLNLFKKKCRGFGKETPVREVITINGGKATDTSPLFSGGDSHK